MVLRRLKAKSPTSIIQMLIHIISWMPLILLAIDYLQGRIDLYNAPLLEERIGQYALLFLLATLSCSPFYHIFHLKNVQIARSTLGKYTFLYALLHFAAFLILDYAFNIRQIAQAYRQTPYLVFGSIAMIILTAMMITSNRKAQALLEKHWKHLHQLLYLAGILVIIHSFLAVKADFRFPIATASVMGILLILRIPFFQRLLYQKRGVTSELPSITPRNKNDTIIF
jgi:sulfoxide reductase heme-binding subunit YedZ